MVKISFIQNELIDKELLPDGKRISFKRLRQALLLANTTDDKNMAIDGLRYYTWYVSVLYSFVIIFISKMF